MVPRCAALVRRGALLALSLGALCVAPRASVALDAPHLRASLRSATLVGVGRVESVSEADYGRVRIVEISLDRQLKPVAPKDAPARTVRVVSITDEPGAARAEQGQRGVLFAIPLQRNSYIDQHVETGDAFAFSGGRDGWLTVADAALPQLTGPIVHLVETARSGARGESPAKRKQKARSFVFSLLDAPHSLLVADGIDSLSSVAGLRGTLTPAEVAVIASVLDDRKHPRAARERLIDSIVTNDLRGAMGVLREVGDPELRRHAWQALRKMGEPVEVEVLTEQLGHDDPHVRIAAARELLASDADDAISVVSATALRDRSREVRLDTIEALGETGKAEAVSPLEKVFTGDDLELRQASARALTAIGGEPAADSFHRLAFAGPIESQRFAVLALLSLGVARDDTRVRAIAERHTDEKIVDMIEHGLKLGHSH